MLLLSSLSSISLRTLVIPLSSVLLQNEPMEPCRPEAAKAPAGGSDCQVTRYVTPPAMSIWRTSRNATAGGTRNHILPFVDRARSRFARTNSATRRAENCARNVLETAWLRRSALRSFEVLLASRMDRARTIYDIMITLRSKLTTSWAVS